MLLKCDGALPLVAIMCENLKDEPFSTAALLMQELCDVCGALLHEQWDQDTGLEESSPAMGIGGAWRDREEISKPLGRSFRNAYPVGSADHRLLFEWVAR